MRNATVKQKVCEQCGKILKYDKQKTNRKFCDENCRNAYHGIVPKKGLTEIRKCRYCKEGFLWSDSTPNQVYCNKECQKAFYRNKAREKLSVEYAEETRECLYCGKEYTWSSSRPNQKYCGRECLNNATRQKFQAPVWTEKRQCAYCGKDFDWFSNKNSQKYCCKECLNAATTARAKKQKKNSREFIEKLRSEIYLKVSEIIGEMQKTQGNTLGDRYIDYWKIGDISEKTREEVLKRDKYECSICKRKDALHLHHIVKRKNGGNHKAENLITLCASCHRHVETGDIQHATNRCLRNAKIHYCLEEKKETVDIDDLRLRLSALFEKLKNSSVGNESEIMIQLDDVLDLLDIQ